MGAHKYSDHPGADRKYSPDYNGALKVHWIFGRSLPRCAWEKRRVVGWFVVHRCLLFPSSDVLHKLRVEEGESGKLVLVEVHHEELVRGREVRLLGGELAVKVGDVLAVALQEIQRTRWDLGTEQAATPPFAGVLITDASNIDLSSGRSLHMDNVLNGFQRGRKIRGHT